MHFKKPLSLLLIIGLATTQVSIASDSNEKADYAIRALASAFSTAACGIDLCINGDLPVFKYESSQTNNLGTTSESYEAPIGIKTLGVAAGTIATLYYTLKAVQSPK